MTDTRNVYSGVIEVELLLNENFLSRYRHNSIPYNTEEESQLPMAAKDNLI